MSMMSGPQPTRSGACRNLRAYFACMFTITGQPYASRLNSTIISFRNCSDGVPTFARYADREPALTPIYPITKALHCGATSDSSARSRIAVRLKIGHAVRALDHPRSVALVHRANAPRQVILRQKIVGRPGTSVPGIIVI